MICAIVLAAGRSRRMGTQKLLLPFGGKTIIAHIVDELLATHLDNISVVVSVDAAKIESALAGRKVNFVTNPQPDADMISSIRCGIASLSPDCHGVLIALGDQPSIRHEWVNELIAAFNLGTHAIVVPFHDNHRGHPLIVSSRYREEILTQYDERGLRGFLDAHGDDVLRLPVASPSVLQDMDHPADYQRELDRLGNSSKFQ